MNDRRHVTRRFTYSLVFLAGLVLGAVGLFLTYGRLALRPPTDEIISLLLIATCGGLGGILYAMRNSILQFPSLHTDGKLDPGFVADWSYGIAGAFVIFLVTPGMSEAIPGASQRGSADTAAISGTATMPTNGVDWMEVIAVALVGGYAGRALMERAVESIARVEEKVESARIEMEDRTKDLQGRIEDLRLKHQYDSEALALTYQQLDLERSPQSEKQLIEAVSHASYEVKSRIFQEIRHLLMDHMDTYAARAVPILKGLIEADQEERFHSSRALLAWTYEAQGKWNEARIAIEHAIRIRDDQNIPGFRRYDEFLARCWIELCPAFPKAASSLEVANHVFQSLKKSSPDDPTFGQVTDLIIRRWLSLNMEPTPQTEQLAGGNGKTEESQEPGMSGRSQ